MANEEHLNQVRAGPESWNRWHADNPKVRPDLTKADLTGGYLAGIHLGAGCTGHP